MDRLYELASRRVAAKRAEEEAIALRREIDAQICGLMPQPEDMEGTVRADAGDLKVVVSYGMTRKVDTAALQDKWAALPIDVQAAFRWKAEISTSEYRKLPAGAAAMVSKFVESKPSAPTVKVEL